MKDLFITEKPSVAMEFAKALNVSSSARKNGYIENDDYIITWCVGHLITMSYPEKYDEDLKKWDLDTLPFIPDKFKYEVIADAKDQYNVVKSLLNRSDLKCIYYAGDSAREGEYIQRLVRSAAGHNENADEKRVWIDSQTEEEILRGIDEAKKLDYYNTLSESAYARAIEDYLIGINFSRALTLMYSDRVFASVGQKSGAIAVGRVMSCVLGMIVDREREIRNDVRTTYYTVTAYIGDNIKALWKAKKGSDKYDYETDLYVNNSACGFLNKKMADQFMYSLGDEIVLKKLENTTERKAAPLLFNLAELQSECSKKYKISPDETLNIAQSLYEKKLTTYPRTDARVLTTAISKEIQNNISGLSEIFDYKNYVKNILDNSLFKNLANTKYVDDMKVSDHYAIIPTGKTQEYGSLSSLEKQVYDLIARRFLAIFYPTAQYQKIKGIFEVDGEEFTSTTSVLSVAGWKEVSGDAEKEDKTNPVMDELKTLSQGQSYEADYANNEAVTSPPSRYTSGSIILAMENAGKLLEEEELREQIKGSGIGTSATRAEIIKKLNKIGYIDTNAKTQVIKPTSLGELIYEVLTIASPNMLSPKLTANWEAGLDAIAKGEITRNDYLKKLYVYVRETTELIKKDFSGELSAKIKKLSATYKEVDGNREPVKPEAITCPLCGSRMYKSKKHGGYYCSGYKNVPPCKFTVWGEISGKKLTDKQLITLIKGNTTEEIKGFKSKAGKSFSCKLRLNSENKVEFVFPKK